MAKATVIGKTEKVAEESTTPSKSRAVLAWLAGKTWLWVAATGIATAAVYWTARGWLVDQRAHPYITISNLSVNLIITLAIWGWYSEGIARKLAKKWKLEGWKRRATVTGITATLIIVLLLWLKLWGYEMRF